jgi:CheY-like chemotaxis protein
MGLFKKKIQVDIEAAALAQEVAVLEQVLRYYAPGHQLPFGSPTRCPQCASFGFVSSVNRGLGVTYNSCLSCNLDWIITIRALKAHQAALRAAAGRQMTSLPGVLFEGDDDESAAGVIDLTGQAARAGSRSDPLQLLLVEDNPDDAAMVEAILRPMMPHAVQIAHVATRHEGENAAKLGFDVVMLDLDLPESRGMATLRSFRDVCPEPPLCVCSGVDDIGMDWRGLAQQNLPKRELPRLVQNVAAGSRELLGLLHLTTTS